MTLTQCRFHVSRCIRCTLIRGLASIIRLLLQIAASPSLSNDAPAGVLKTDLLAPVTTSKDVVTRAAGADFGRGCIDTRA